MTTTTPIEEDGVKRRDFLYIAAGGVGAVGTALAVWPFVAQMNPSADVLALSSTEVELDAIDVGSEITAVWQGKPVFVRHRTKEEIAAAEDVDITTLPDPQADADRVENPAWLIMVGVCTHLGCVPLKESGDYDGWFCPCHGSHYDTSGRIRKGPAPTNLLVPPYEFLSDTTVKIG
ncbi:MAG: ubiquinol-cytochrome c reductase iron-sulfur subunit [Sneathiella sp.]